MMDLTEPFQNIIQDFFEQSRINNLVLPIQNETHKYSDEQQIFDFRNDRNQRQILHSGQCIQEQQQPKQHLQISMNEDNSVSDINHIDKLMVKNQSSQQQLMNHLDIMPKSDNNLKIQQKETFNENEECVDTPDLENIITFLVEFPHNSITLITQAVSTRFPQFYRMSVVQVLMQKFSKLKKTKEQLIKYCMRKAFKFILQLPNNQHIIDGDRRQKYSFSKCKNKYLKRVSQQKSMNNKFLQQIFSQCDFKRDYIIFLQHFEGIMVEDNQKKINYLALLLTNQKEGKVKSVEMVKRLPWTKVILDKVLKISNELLKFSEQTSV